MTVNMFKNMDNAETIAAGTTIFSEGDEPGGMMYILLDGEVDILCTANALIP
jgi:CRP-like cAMP-binding protein